MTRSVDVPPRSPDPVALMFPYKLVAAGQTNSNLGANGGIGDYLSHVLVVPAVAAAGAVTIKDGSTTVVAFPGGGTTPLPSLIPFVIPVNAKSVSGAWNITTGSGVAVVALGAFTE